MQINELVSAIGQTVFDQFILPQKTAQRVSTNLGEIQRYEHSPDETALKAIIAEEQANIYLIL